MVQRKFVFADSDRCIGCQTCMAACLSAHGVGRAEAIPRLQLVMTRTVSAPVSCHHCIDAPCVASCPTGCLYYDGGRVGIREERCIGCCSCVLACPFGAIVIGSRPKNVQFGGISFKAGTEPVVIKCDLCVNRNNRPACVEACPTAGLFLADEELLEQETKRKRMDAATGARSDCR